MARVKAEYFNAKDKATGEVKEVQFIPPAPSDGDLGGISKEKLDLIDGVENEINLCNGKLPTLTSSSAIYNQSEQIENGDWIYFEPITCDSADVTGVNHVDLGTIADVGTSNRTYYAGLSKIIRELASISPKAKIFVNTCPKTTKGYFEYNNAVREIVELYKGTYNVHCIDLSKYSYLYENSSLVNDMVNGHYTAIGYEQFAEIYEYILSEYINNHISEFQNVHEIECD